MFSRRYSQDGKASLVQHFIEKEGNCATSPIVRARTGMSTLLIPTLFTVVAYSEDFARQFAAIIDAEKQSSLLASHGVSLLDLGKQLDYPELHIKHPSGGRDMIIRAGLLSWTHFNEVAEGRAIRASMEIARSILSRAFVKVEVQPITRYPDKRKPSQQ